LSGRRFTWLPVPFEPYCRALSGHQLSIHVAHSSEAVPDTAWVLPLRRILLSDWGVVFFWGVFFCPGRLAPVSVRPPRLLRQTLFPPFFFFDQRASSLAAIGPSSLGLIRTPDLLSCGFSFCCLSPSSILWRLWGPLFLFALRKPPSRLRRSHAFSRRALFYRTASFRPRGSILRRLLRPSPAFSQPRGLRCFCHDFFPQIFPL